RLRRQDFDLKITQRQIGATGDQVSAEVPLPVAGTALVGWQRLQERIADAHGEAALRLPEHNLGDQRLAALEDAVSLGDAQRAGAPLDLDPHKRATHRCVDRPDAVVVSRRKFDVAAVKTLERPTTQADG